jgi:hypothetical protein
MKSREAIASRTISHILYVYNILKNDNSESNLELDSLSENPKNHASTVMVGYGFCPTP